MKLKMGFSEKPVRPPGGNPAGNATLFDGGLMTWQRVAVVLFVIFMTGWINHHYFDMLLADHAMRSWTEVPARIVSAGLQRNAHAKGGDTRRATAKFTYEFGGQSYTSSRVTWDSGSDSMGSFQGQAAAELEAHQRSGRPFRCFVNPIDPSQAVVYRDLRPEILVLFTALEMLLGMPLVLILADQTIRLIRRLASPGWPREEQIGEPAAAEAAEGPVASSSARSGRERAIWTPVFAVAANALTIPLFDYLSAAPAGNFWPKVFGGMLVGIAWISIWPAIAALRPAKPRSPLALIPTNPDTHRFETD